MFDIQEKQKLNSSGNRSVIFKVGQKVVVRDYRRGHKPWIQGVILSESVPGITYIIDVDGSSWKRHVNQMINCDESLNE